jgi:hypothetical protein
MIFAATQRVARNNERRRMSHEMTRREFIKHTAVAGAAAAAGLGAAGRAPGEEAAPKLLPTVKLGGLEVSRFILGSNPFWGYSHKSPKLDEEMKAFHTDERIIATLDEAARCGLTTIASPPEERWIELFGKYVAGGGKLKIWLAQCHVDPSKMKEDIDRSIKGGAKAVFIQGHRVEQQFKIGAFDTLRAWIDQIKAAGLPAGLASHWPEIHLEIERRKFPTDFYYQCFYNVTAGPTYREEERAKAIEVIAKIDKPVIAYKILAAGRLAPADGFEFAFNHIRRKDGVCVGIYMKDAQDQIRQNATFTEMLTAAGEKKA